MNLDASGIWSQLEVKNEKELLAYLGTSSVAFSQATSTLHWVITGVESNDYNGVLSTRLTEPLIDQTIQEVLDRFQNSQVPFMWFVDPSDNPSDLALRLLDRGCRRLDPGHGMGIQLRGLPKDVLTRSDVIIRRVSTLQESAAWINVWRQMHGELSPVREALYNSLLFQPQARLRNYVAWSGDLPVGITQLFLGTTSAGLYCEAVLEPYQHQGIGTALVHTALSDAYQAGYEWMITGPTQESVRMYQRIGFASFESQAEIYHRWPAF